MSIKKQKEAPVAKKRPGPVREKALRWTLNRAGREFGVHREQLERRRRALGIEAAPDGFFSSRELSLMLFGDKEAETIGKIAAERAKIERENREAEGEIIPVELVGMLGERYVAAVRQVILNSSLSDAEKSEALTEIVELGERDWREEAKQAAKK